MNSVICTDNYDKKGLWTILLLRNDATYLISVEQLLSAQCVHFIEKEY